MYYDTKIKHEKHAWLMANSRWLIVKSKKRLFNSKSKK